MGIKLLFSLARAMKCGVVDQRWDYAGGVITVTAPEGFLFASMLCHEFQYLYKPDAVSRDEAIADAVSDMSNGLTKFEGDPVEYSIHYRGFDDQELSEQDETTLWVIR